MPRASIPELYQAFEKAYASMQAIPPAKGPSASTKDFDRAVNKCTALAKRIAQAPATDVVQILLKLRVVTWDVNEAPYSSLEDLDRWKPGRFNDGAEYDFLDRWKPGRFNDGAEYDFLDRWKLGRFNDGAEYDFLASLREDLLRASGSWLALRRAA